MDSVPTDSQTGGCCYAASYWAGLTPVVRVDVKECLGRLDVVRTYHGRRHDAIAFRFPGSPSDLLELRSVVAVWAVVAAFEGLPVSGPKGLARLCEILAAADLDGPLAAAGAARGTPLNAPPRFVLTTNIIGHHNFGRQDVGSLVTEWLQREAGWQADPDDYDVNFRVQVFRDVGFLGLQLTGPRTQRHDYRVVNREGSLAPSIAYCMARMTEPAATDVFMDPMCGAGTLAVERGLGWSVATLLCGDIAEDAVQAASANLRAAGLDVSAQRWDATDLPLEDGSVCKIATNMPYGKDVALKSPGTFVPALVGEMARVIRPGGRLVVLTAHGRKLLRELARSKAFRAHDPTRLEHLGFRLSLVTAERR